jgi:hypothetical protein
VTDPTEILDEIEAEAARLDAQRIAVLTAAVLGPPTKDESDLAKSLDLTVADLRRLGGLP